MSLTTNSRSLILPVATITSILVLLVPLPSILLDFLIAANITLAVIVLLTTIYVRTPLEFSVFPSILLASTLGRLVLNVASTRLILTRAETEKSYAAGGVIKSFGEFVAGDMIIVGLIIFVIIIVIQFVVVTKGATRISEVAARFALDGMPGRQMAIDADLNAGMIDVKEARRRREEITQQADFYGAMDGASKFVRGDAIAGILITLINIGGGLLVGIFFAGMSVVEASSLFTKLTIGDGLATQIPAFLIALAAALLVTRSTKRIDLPTEFLTQLFSRPQALAISAVFLVLLVFTKMPAVPLISIAIACAGLAWMINREKRRHHDRMMAASETSRPGNATKTDERIEDYLAIDPMELEIGIGLIRLADPHRGGDLLARVTGVRQSVATELGIILPKVRIRDNMRLEETQYRVRIANNAVADGHAFPDRLLAIDSGRTSGLIEGESTRDPASGRPAVWIETTTCKQAETLGYTSKEPVAVIATHVQEVVRRHADELLTRDATQHLINELKKTSPAVVEELIPAMMKLSEVQQVLQMLLREEVSIRQLGLILETLGDYAGKTKDPICLTEYVRQRLARTICTHFQDEERRLHVVTLDPALEDHLVANIEQNDQGLVIRMSPASVESTCKRISDELEKLIEINRPPVILVSPQSRPGLKQLTTNMIPHLVVLSYNEITRDTQINSVGLVTEITADLVGTL
jgi:flagellar biosynthesis protein FlhA